MSRVPQDYSGYQRTILLCTVDPGSLSLEPIHIHVEVGNNHVLAVFKVVRSSELPVLLRARFVDRFVKEVFPPEHKTMLNNSAPAPTIFTVVSREKYRPIIIRRRKSCRGKSR